LLIGLEKFVDEKCIVVAPQCLRDAREGGRGSWKYEELNEWLKRDPIEIHKEFLINQDMMSKKEIDELEKKEIVLVEEALEFARKSPYPDPSQLYDDLFTDPISFA